MPPPIDQRQLRNKTNHSGCETHEIYHSTGRVWYSMDTVRGYLSKFLRILDIATQTEK